MDKLKKAIFIIAILAAIASPLYSQTAEKLEILLNEPKIIWSDAAAFVLEAADVYTGNQDDSFYFALEKNWLPKNVFPGDSVRLNGLALLLMQSFDIKGGIFYSISKSPHHAYRELVYKNIIRGAVDPDMPVSGQQLLLLIGRILSIKEQS